MRLLHYSRAPLTTKLSMSQPSEHFKPCGLWVSVEGKDDWRSWCESEQWSVERYVWQTPITLTGKGKSILHIGPSDLDAFDAEHQRLSAHRGDKINWHKLADKHSGIIIAPYSWEHRLADGFLWYYAWDCASGCLWDAAAWEIASPSEPVAFRRDEEAA